MAEQTVKDTTSHSAAAEEARRRLSENPSDVGAYWQLAAALRSLGDADGAREAELSGVEASQSDPDIARAASAMMANDLRTAEAALNALLKRRPDDPVALRMVAEILIRQNQPRKAEAILRRAIDLAPSFFFPRYTRAVALDMLSRAGEALAELNQIEGPEAEYDPIMGLKALALSRVGENEQAIELCRQLLERQPTNPEIWISLANLLKIVGDNQGSVDAYRKVIEIQPTNGEAWWSLANLKTYRFGEEDIAAMEAAVNSAGLGDNDRFRIHFALGKAREDRGEDEASFDHYRLGNSLRAMQARYRPGEATNLVDRMLRLFTREFFEERAGFGCKASDPIFIIGMPRAGSTLVEQILGSHPLVEGTAELPDVIVLARELEEGPEGGPGAWRNYPEMLADLSSDDFRRLGETYLERTRIQRKTDRPFFTDKMPNNWIHAGLIRLMLPNAKIIDARRHPLACGFSNFKQHYARGQEFSYDLEHFGRYYRDYVRLMAHLDAVAPGTVHRVIYERLLASPEEQIRSLLDYLGLPFDKACLNFHENKRAVRTASAEQVRRPIDREGAESWKRFEPWLDPLKQSLGEALSDWGG